MLGIPIAPVLVLVPLLVIIRILSGLNDWSRDTFMTAGFISVLVIIMAWGITQVLKAPKLPRKDKISS